ncbi:transglutaminase [Meridianimarinicoccus roseus]|uniref:Transglutaminase n=1 Tax=Meridianimarinicoccus roseus TaxID=2072018 RepID=A0A2V2LCH5_9RHOB|nr:transglutaminase family protein [Meridianimarinicoccus roseus]PWR03240.1 transglutaminase [Meridianimarinicoccus roseus]
MRYDIRLRITHDYPGAAGTGRHQIRVVPADIAGRQRLTVQQLVVTPAAAEYATRRDFFGNTATTVMHDTPHARMSIAMRAQVEILPRSGDLDVSAALTDLPGDIASVTSLSAEAPHHFLGPSPRIPADDGMAAYARACLSPGMTARGTVQAIGARLNADMAFDAQATNVDTPASEAFAARRGVCQDFTHIMITCLRSLGVPAGYVSGYLRTEPPPGQPRLDGADAMHAWVRAWCGTDAGWVEYDPTNAITPAADHIVVAVGRDYDDIAPVQGILRTAGPNVSTQAVDVIPVSDNVLR